ncbi:hypothetical protein ADIAL_2100 [Alkalibacterium sp. AK22]|uniref:DUF2075 domain-containing protein n=1 Tax=Alkalibacterium sp. AK22 TaxID=1229520 RepID=UPI00044E0B99|nr:DUF2075 domain-containing protein [Alkalibacterium sp. AK22]EXJ22514.1 hypothetical protein ADIAL_2100 [Alkalibacterium sp. AK22]
MSDIHSPEIYEVDYSAKALSALKHDLSEKSRQAEKLIFEYPTVYIINHKENHGISVYVGETANISRRTIQHLGEDSPDKQDWLKINRAENVKMFVVGHDFFNKSLTLDIENKLMLYMSTLDGVKNLYNRRSNDQNDYYTSDMLDDIFSKVWCKLREKNRELFPLERLVKDSALFKASPFHKLTKEQTDAKDKIHLKILEALTRDIDEQLIFVDGAAGTGKTVLLSSLFYDLFKEDNEYDPIYRQKKNYLLVNHDEQLNVYQQIMEKLGVLKNNKQSVTKPTSFINKVSPEEKADVVLIDEGHLLLTQGKQSYRGKNHLEDILKRAKVVILIFDKNQILTTEQYWEDHKLIAYQQEARVRDNYIELKNQIRINAEQKTINWIRTLVDHQHVLPVPNDSRYDLRIMDTPEALNDLIEVKAKDQEYGLSRLLATYDWPYSSNKLDSKNEYWKVKIDNWTKPWNLLSHEPKDIKRKIKGLAWAEQPQTINQVGSTFTIQGFDLNYAGVIIGPSVVYRNGKVQFRPSKSANKKATRRRTLDDGSKQSFGDTFLRNELNVLLTRGVNGLYIYAVDNELREALLKADLRL